MFAIGWLVLLLRSDDRTLLPAPVYTPPATEPAAFGGVFLSLRVGGSNLRIVLFWLGTKARRTTFGLGTASDRLGTDRHRSRQRTATICVFGFATVQSVRNALADIERARLSEERLAVRTASCGSRRERFASRRVGEHVSFDVSLCTSCQS